MDDVLMMRRMSKVSYDNTGHISAEVKTCFQVKRIYDSFFDKRIVFINVLIPLQFCKWADVSLVSANDQYVVRVHSMVLAASCPLLYSVLRVNI